MDLETHLGVHAQALKLRSQRMQLLASNLANADTPGYHARDIDFRSALAAAAESTDTALLRTHRNHLSAGDAQSAAATLKYRVPLAPALDGNTVDVQLEQAAFAQNTVRYQATLQFLNSKLRGLMSAITGQ